jgi:hypothetical protein
MFIHHSNQHFLRRIEIRRRTSLPTLDTPILVLVFTSHFPEVLRQGTSIQITQRHKRDPVVVGFVFEPNFHLKFVSAAIGSKPAGRGELVPATASVVGD